MSNIISNLIKEKKDINNDIIALTMLIAAKDGAEIYLNSTLTSSNPELRMIYANGLGQMVAGHTALTELAITKSWINPQKPILQQLSDEYNESSESNRNS